MLLTIAILYVGLSVVFFGALAIAASQPIPAMEDSDQTLAVDDLDQQRRAESNEHLAPAAA